jgi:hypothetical protein
MTNETVTIGTDVQMLVGRTIVSARREDPSKEKFPMYDETLYLTLDDGSEWEFSGEGYDASSLVIEAKFR